MNLIRIASQAANPFMKLLQFIPIKLTFILILGILLGAKLNIKPFIPLFFAGLSLFVLRVLLEKSRFRQSSIFGVIAAFLTINLGVLTVGLAKAETLSDHYSYLGLDHHSTMHLKIKEVLKSNSFSNRFIAEMQGTNQIKIGGMVLLSISVDTISEALFVDDEIAFWGSVQEIKPPGNPHQFDYKKYMESLGVYHQIQLKQQQFYLKPTPTKTIYGSAASIRNVITQKLRAVGFENDELGVIQALLLGQRSNISNSTYDNYKKAGAVHMLAVSGLHIGIVLLLLEFVLQPLEFLPGGKTIKLVVIVLLLWCFAFLAGLSASVVRAVTMFSFVAYAIYLNRPTNTFNILALSMFFILLLYNPLFLFQVGFQMSYAAVLAIVWIYPKLQRFWYPGNIMIRKIWQLFSVSLAAQIGVFPISLFYFHQFPGLFFVSNLLIIPFLGLILGLGIAVIVLAMMNILPGTLVLIYANTIKTMNAIVGWVAQHDAFVFRDIRFDGIQLFLSYGILISLVVLLTKSSFKRMAAFLAGILGFQVWLFILGHNLRQKESLILLHQTANTVLFHQQAKSLTVHSTHCDRVEGLIANYSAAEAVLDVAHRPIRNSYTIDGKSLVIVDSTGILPHNFRIDILVLIQSPKVNLERYLNAIKPMQVIADGSNYHSYIARWRQSCAKGKLPFHYTGEKGAYFFYQKD